MYFANVAVVRFAAGRSGFDLPPVQSLSPSAWRASNHHVTPAFANAATLCASSSLDGPLLVPNCTISNGAALLRYFEISAHTSRICSTLSQPEDQAIRKRAIVF